MCIISRLHPNHYDSNLQPTSSAPDDFNSRIQIAAAIFILQRPPRKPSRPPPHHYTLMAIPRNKTAISIPILFLEEWQSKIKLYYAYYALCTSLESFTATILQSSDLLRRQATRRPGMLAGEHILNYYEQSFKKPFELWNGKKKVSVATNETIHHVVLYYS